MIVSIVPWIRSILSAYPLGLCCLYSETIIIIIFDDLSFFFSSSLHCGEFERNFHTFPVHIPVIINLPFPPRAILPFLNRSRHARTNNFAKLNPHVITMNDVEDQHEEKGKLLLKNIIIIIITSGTTRVSLPHTIP